MKKIAFVAVLFAACLAFCPSVHASADAADDIMQSIDMSGIYEALGEDAENIGTLEQIEESFGVHTILSYAVKLILRLAKPLLADTAVIFSYIAAAAVIKKLCSEFDAQGMKYASKLCTVLVISAAAVGIISADFEEARELLLRIRAYYSAVVPVMSTLYIVGANVSAAAASAAASDFVLSAVGILAESVVLPAMRLCLALCIAGAVSDDVSFSPISDFVKNACSKLIAYSMMLVNSGMLLSCKLASAADGTLVRSLKFASSSFIPVIGAAVSEATSTVLGSVSAVRTSFGAFGVIALLYLLLPTLIRIAVHKGVLGLAASFAKALGCDAESSLLSSVSGIYAVALSALIATAVCFTMSAAILAGTKAV